MTIFFLWGFIKDFFCFLFRLSWPWRPYLWWGPAWSTTVLVSCNCRVPESSFFHGKLANLLDKLARHTTCTVLRAMPNPPLSTGRHSSRRFCGVLGWATAGPLSGFQADRGCAAGPMYMPCSGAVPGGLDGRAPERY